jgi:hypothetical protein
MPTDAERLNIRSNQATIQTAISSCISQLSRERPDITQDQAIAI